MRDFTRRDFLKFLGAGAVGLAAMPRLGRAWGKGLVPDDFASDVVQCYDDGAVVGNVINETIAQTMMDESIKALTGLVDVGEAWKSVFPGIALTSIIGIKVNCINSSLPTHPQVVRCITSGLARMDFSGALFSKNNVIIWDRTDSELIAGGFSIYTGSDPATVRCFGTDHSGVGYDTSLPFNVNGVTSYPSRILSQQVDYLVDAAVLKTHSMATCTMCLKNHYGSVNNPGSLHGSYCNPYIPALNAQIRDVITPNNIQKLFVIDGLRALYSGGPGGSPNCTPKIILMSRDPVACDYQGQNVINIERANRSRSPVSAAHILTAAQEPYNLGTTDVRLIEVFNPSAIAESPAARTGERLAIAPQPLRGQGVISLDLAQAGRVQLDLVDASGRVAAGVFQGHLARGGHRVNCRVDARLPNGTYVLRCRTQGATRTCPVVVAR